jgi:hypothetical protein
VKFTVLPRLLLGSCAAAGKTVASEAQLKSS